MRIFTMMRISGGARKRKYPEIRRGALILFLFYAHLQNTALCAQADSTAEAHAIAMRVVQAMGGMDHFENTHYIGWNFFGYRQLIWDKLHDRVRIDYFSKDLTIITSLNSDDGKVFLGGREVRDPDSLKILLNKGRTIWMNDSYWLVMPFKLFDPGVNLQYMGRGLTSDSTEAYVLRLSFNHVGVTPDNMYNVYIDTSTFLVVQWDYFSAFGHNTPEISDPWGDYRKYGNILLSADRGAEGKITDIHVWNDLPASLFSDPDVPEFDALK